MKKLFILFSFMFFIPGWAEGNKVSEIMKNLEGSIEKIEDVQVKNFRGDVYFNLSLGEPTYNTIGPYLEKIFEKKIPKKISFHGKLLGTFSEGKLYKLLIKGNSEIGSFVFMKNGDDFKILIPELQLQVEDKISQVKEFIKQKKKAEDDKIMKSPVNLYINKERLKKGLEELNKVMEEAEVKNKRGKNENLYELGIDMGKIRILVYEKYWTIKELQFSNPMGNLTFIYPKPEDEKITLFNFLPKEIKLNIKKKEDSINMELKNLEYNLLLDEGDFKITKLNFSEFVTYMYFKLSTAK